MELQSVIHRSPVILALRIVFLEIMIEIVYLSLGFLFALIARELGYNMRFISPITQLLLLPIQIAVLFIMLMRWARETYEIHEKEVVIKTGIFRISEQAFPYNNMQSVKIRQSFLERIIGAGTVSVFVPTLSKDLVFFEVPNPHGFAEIIKKALPYPEKGQYIMRR